METVSMQIMGMCLEGQSDYIGSWSRREWEACGQVAPVRVLTTG